MIQAFTDKSYLENEAVETDEAVTENNVKLQLKGGEKMSNWLKRYLRFHLTKAPEELIEAIDAHLLSDECLSMIATHLGVDHLVRTREHPPTNEACANALRALAGVLSDEKAKNLVIDFIVPQLVDVDFADIYPLADPMGVLKDLLKADGVAEVEPRILRSAGEVSAEPIFVVGIYADKKKLVGQSAGESLQVAMDMAAREALLRLWDITSDRVLFFGDRAAKSPLEQYSKENYRLSEKCSKQTDLSLETFEMLKQEPMNLIETVLRYRNEVDRVVGKSYTKRLRHKFSRGSLAKRSFKYLVKPKPYTVA